LQALSWVIIGLVVLVVIAMVAANPKKTGVLTTATTSSTAAAGTTTTVQGLVITDTTVATTVPVATTTATTTPTTLPATTVLTTTVQTAPPPTSPSPTARPTTTLAGGALCGAPANPYGYNLCGRGGTITQPAAGTCGYFNCIANFSNGTGYMEECMDGTYSMSGGRSGSCSSHHGNKQPVFSGP
jgi:hypothetical protein